MSTEVIKIEVKKEGDKTSNEDSKETSYKIDNSHTFSVWLENEKDPFYLFSYLLMGKFLNELIHL
jgi:hypothetical protein